MEHCPACGSYLDGSFCPHCGIPAVPSPTDDRGRRAPEVFLVDVCKVCNGVVGISCRCEPEDPGGTT